MDHNFSRIIQFSGYPAPPTREFPCFFNQNAMSLDYFKLLFDFQEHQIQKIYYSRIAQNLTSLRREYQASIEKSRALNQHDPIHLFNQSQTVQIPNSAKMSKKLSEKVKQEEVNGKECQSGLRAQITQMVSYFIEEYGKDDQNTFDQQRSRYVGNKALLELFDALKEKYSKARKCREDMIRLALRKALTCLRDSLRDELNVSAKEASMELCRRYFGVKSEGLIKLEDASDEKSQEDDLSFLLPYKKNSKYSTPNMCFIREIFASKEFNQDYTRYLSQLDEILELDNNKKIPKFVDFLVDCVQKNLIYRVKNYKRLPWLTTWLKATKIVAVELLDPNTWKDIHRKKFKSSKNSKSKVNSVIKVEQLS